jgi:hypothetical protein
MSFYPLASHMFDADKKYEVANTRISQFCELAEMVNCFATAFSQTLYEITDMYFYLEKDRFFQIINI